jgi:acetoacetate decarboxylase
MKANSQNPLRKWEVLKMSSSGGVTSACEGPGFKPLKYQGIKSNRTNIWEVMN